MIWTQQNLANERLVSEPRERLMAIGIQISIPPFSWAHTCENSLHKGLALHKGIFAYQLRANNGLLMRILGPKHHRSPS